MPPALLGADITVFNISEDNKEYAFKVFEAANVDFEICDLLETDAAKYGDFFDVVSQLAVFL